MTSVSFIASAQPIRAGLWRFSLERQGGIPVLADAEISQAGEGLQIVFTNHNERLPAAILEVQGDSVYIEMPLFESRFALRVSGPERLDGTFIKGTSGDWQRWLVKAMYGQPERFAGVAMPGSPANLSGKWDFSFQRPDGSWRPAVAELIQNGTQLTGTIINPSGDYRYLQGTVQGSHWYLSAFDGGHIYAFAGQVVGDSAMPEGQFFSGSLPITPFRASRNPNARLPVLPPVTDLKPGQNRLNFRFPDLDSQWVGIQDDRFKGKVTIVQIMGSWCPNCMDETRFLSDFYNRQTQKDVEIVSLAYELSTDFGRSVKSLRRFQQRFDVRYPMLVTGVRSADDDKAAKTLPQLTDIKYFPTTLFIDKQGVVRKVHSGFYGPGAPDYFEAYKKEFFETLDVLKGE